MSAKHVDPDTLLPFLGRDVSRRLVLRRLAGGGVAAATGVGALRLAPGTIAQEATPPTAATTPVAEAPIIEELDISFGAADLESLELDAFRPPARDAPRPAVVVLSGWLASRRDYHEQARALARAGYVAFCIDYRRGSPGYLDDAQYAVRWIRANAARFGIDPERIGSYGHSSGGHLAAMLGVRDTVETGDQAPPVLAEYPSRVRCVVELAGVNDMTVPSTPTRGIGSAVLKGTVEKLPEAYRALSPIAYVDAQSAPFLLVHGPADTMMPVDDSRRMAEALQTAGVEVIFAYLADVDHFNVALWDTNGALTLAFFERHLHPDQ